MLHQFRWNALVITFGGRIPSLLLGCALILQRICRGAEFQEERVGACSNFENSTRKDGNTVPSSQRGQKDNGGPARSQLPEGGLFQLRNFNAKNVKKVAGVMKWPDPRNNETPVTGSFD